MLFRGLVKFCIRDLYSTRMFLRFNETTLNLFHCLMLDLVCNEYRLSQLSIEQDLGDSLYYYKVCWKTFWQRCDIECYARSYFLLHIKNINLIYCEVFNSRLLCFSFQYFRQKIQTSSTNFRSQKVSVCYHFPWTLLKQKCSLHGNRASRRGQPADGNSWKLHIPDSFLKSELVQ